MPSLPPLPVAAPQLARALEGNSRLKTLHLDDNELGVAAGEALAAALVPNKTLTALSLMDNPRLGDAACEALNYALYHNLSLKVLNVRGCSATVVNRALGSERELFGAALPDAMRQMRIVTADLPAGSPKGSGGSAGSGGGSRARSAVDWPAPSPTGSVASNGSGGGGGSQRGARAGSSLSSSSSASVPMHRAPGNRLAALNVGNAAGASTRSGRAGAAGGISEAELGEALRASHMRSMMARR